MLGVGRFGRGQSGTTLDSAKAYADSLAAVLDKKQRSTNISLYILVSVLLVVSVVLIGYQLGEEPLAE